MGLEWLALAFEKDVETQKGTGLLISRPWTVSAAGTPSPPPASSQLLTREVEEGSGPPSCLAGTPQRSLLLLRHPPCPPYILSRKPENGAGCWQSGDPRGVN